MVVDNRFRLLVLAVEDLTGLWDARLELDHEPLPEEAARAALVQLISEGLIVLFVADDLPRASPRMLDGGEALDALGPGLHWSVPNRASTGPFVYFAATDAGVALVQGLHWGGR